MIILYMFVIQEMIRVFEDFRFSLEDLEEFLEKWKGRPALSILTSNPIYKGEDYVKVIKKYKKRFKNIIYKTNQIFR